MSRYGIMATQLLATLTTVHHPFKRGIVVYLVNLRHLFHSIPLEVCFVSQLERCFYVSFRGLILSCSTFEKNDSFRVFPFLSLSWLAGVLRARLQDNDGDRINVPMKCNLDREDYTSLCFPFVLPYTWISGRDSCLVGVSCHIPSSGLTYACFHLCIMFKFLKLELRNLEASKP